MFLLSLPARGAWIEIEAFDIADQFHIVAPREGSVDRNKVNIQRSDTSWYSPRGVPVRRAAKQLH